MSKKKENWQVVEDKIKEKWKDFGDDDIESLKGNLGNLVSLLENVYGYAKDKAEVEYKDFKESLENVLKEVKENKTFGVYTAVLILGLLSIASLITASFLRKNHRV